MALHTLPSNRHPSDLSGSDSNHDDSHDKDDKGSPEPSRPRRSQLRCRVCGAILNPQPMRSPPKDAPRGKHPVAGVHRYRNGGIIECPYSPHPYALARQVNRMVIAEAAEVAGIARPAGRADLTARLTRPRERQGSGLGQDSEDDEEDEDEDEDEEEDEDEDVDDDDDDEDDDEDEEGEEVDSSPDS